MIRWLFEVKWDGFRAIARSMPEGNVTLTCATDSICSNASRNSSRSCGFRSLPVVSTARSARSTKQADLVSGAATSRHERGAEGPAPLTFVAFDVLYADGRDLRALPLEERKTKLEKTDRARSRRAVSKHIIGRGKDSRARATRRLEGIIASGADSPYRMSRSRDWFKFKAKHEEEFVIALDGAEKAA